MSFFDFFKNGNGKEEVSSAQTAKDRLSVIVASDHRLSNRLHPEKIERMKREVLDVVTKYVNGVSIDDVIIHHRTEVDIDVIEMNINLPDGRNF